MIDQIYSYREMCNTEGIQTLQRGMNFRFKPNYSLILMSRRVNAPYRDKILDDGVTIEYEGHDVPKTSFEVNPKYLDQPEVTRNGKLTQNGHFIEAVRLYNQKNHPPEVVKVYEKIMTGIWSLKGYFKLVGYKPYFDGSRTVFIFTLQLSEDQSIDHTSVIDISHTRLISTEVKKEVWQRDKGACVLCGSNKNLHFDHDLPYSRGGSSLTALNIRLLCAKHNLAKSNKIE